MRREEALNLVKQVLPCLNIDEKIREAFETLVPELHESEDERIRKGLIEVVSDIAGGWPFEEHRITKKEALAYLERQKEWKPIFKEGDRVIWDGEEFNILDVHKGAYNVGGYIVPFSRERELHPIGQKPAEWSEKDEKMRNGLISLIEEIKLRPLKRLEDWDGYIHFLKSLRPRPSWKPSEEQMKWLKDVIETVPMSCRQQSALESLYADLQKLLAYNDAKDILSDLEESLPAKVVEGWVAADSNTDGKRRVTLFPKKPVRDVLTEYKYWAATCPRYESIELDSNAFPNLKWEDEPKKVRIIILPKEG